MTMHTAHRPDARHEKAAQLDRHAMLTRWTREADRNADAQGRVVALLERARERFCDARTEAERDAVRDEVVALVARFERIPKFERFSKWLARQ